MKLIYQTDNIQHPFVLLERTAIWWTANPWHDMQFSQFHKSHGNWYVLMLDDKYFIFKEENFHFYTSNELTLPDIKIRELEMLVNYSDELHGTQKLFCYIDEAKVNWTATQYILGKSWLFHITMRQFFLSSEWVRYVKQYFWNEWLSIDIFPSSFRMQRYLWTILHKEHYILLYINENSTKAIIVNNGLIAGIHYIQIWEKTIKQLLKDHNVFSFYYSNSQGSVQQMAYGLVNKIIWFVAKQRSDWLISLWWQNKDIIIIGDVVSHPVIMSGICDSLTQTLRSFVVPFRSSILNAQWILPPRYADVSTRYHLKNN